MNLDWRIIKIALLVLAGLATSSASAMGWSDRSPLGQRTGSGGSSRGWNFALELGVRASLKYNRVLVSSTPPEVYLAEGQLQLWYYRSMGFYVSYGHSVSLGPAQTYGFGFKLPLLVFDGGSSRAIGGLSLMLVGDMNNYGFDPPPDPSDYPTSMWVFRYGGEIQWSFGAGIFLDTTMMVSTINNNFFIAPLVGLGFKF